MDTWRKEDNLFFETEAYRYALEQCRRHSFITIAGTSGAGKSAIAYHIALHLEKEGYSILPVTHFRDIKQYHDYSDAQVFIFDDPFGLASFDSKKAEDVQSLSADIYENFPLGESKIIFTSRKNVIESSDSFLTEDKSVVHKNIIDLNTDDLKLTIDEKQQMFENHTKHLDSPAFDQANILKRDQSNFPLLCKMYGCNVSFQKKGHTFFDDPFSAIIHNIKEFKSKMAPEYIALLLCAFCDGHLDLKAFQAGAYKTQEEFVYSLINVESRLPQNIVEEAMEKLKATYLIKENLQFRFIHESLLETVLYHSVKEYKEQIYQHSSLNFIQGYLNVIEARTERLTAIECSLLSDRHIEEIKKGNFLDVFFNPFFEDDDILISFIRKLELLKSSELTQMMLQIKTRVDQERLNLLKKENLWNRMAALNLLLERKDVKAFHWILALNISILFHYISSRVEDFPGKQNAEIQLKCISFLHAACLGGNTEVVGKLLKTENVGTLQHKCEPLKTTALHMAVYSRVPEMAKMVIEKMSVQHIDIQNMFSSTPLFEASALGLESICTLLIEKGAKVNLPSKGCLSPLWIAAEMGHVDIVKLLLKNGADINHADEDGATPLFIAAEKGQSEVVKILLAHGADVYRCDKEKVSPLYIAAQNGFKEVVIQLLEKKAKINQRENNGESALYISARNGHKDIVDLLLEKGSSVNLCDKDGVSPLNIACQNGHTETVMVLLKNKAAVNQQDRQGVSPLYIACQCGHVKTVEFLLINDVSKADIELRDRSDVSPLYIASHYEHVETVDVLLKHGANVNQRTDDGATPLYIAAFQGNKKITERLLKKKAEVNTCDSSGVTPLFMAAQGGHEECICLLLKHGAEVNKMDNDGISPLLVAVENEYAGAVKILLENGAVPTQCDKEGRSPLTIAEKQDQHEIVTFLKNAPREKSLSETL